MRISLSSACLPRTAVAQPAAAPPAKTTVKWYGHAAFEIDPPSGKIDPYRSVDDEPVEPDRQGRREVGQGRPDPHHARPLRSRRRRRRDREAHEGARSSRRSISATRSSARWASRRTSSASTPAATSAARSRCSAARPRSRSCRRSTARRSARIRRRRGQGGNPGGFVIAVKGGPTIYHTGDTDLFGDMALIGTHFKIDLMLACIGDHFTMGPGARGRGRQARQGEAGRADALRHVPGADGHARRVRQGAQEGARRARS